MKLMRSINLNVSNIKLILKYDEFFAKSTYYFLAKTLLLQKRAKLITQKHPKLLADYYYQPCEFILRNNKHLIYQGNIAEFIDLTVYYRGYFDVQFALILIVAVQYLACTQKVVFFDVGTNLGFYIILLADSCHHIHSF